MFVLCLMAPSCAKASKVEQSCRVFELSDVACVYVNVNLNLNLIKIVNLNLNLKLNLKLNFDICI